MNIWEILGGVLLLITSVLIIILVTVQNTNEKGMSSAISGANSSSYLGKNGGRDRDAVLAKITNVMAVVFFVIALAVNIVAAFVK